MPRSKEDRERLRTYHLEDFEWLEGDEYFLNQDLLMHEVYELYAQPAVHVPTQMSPEEYEAYKISTAHARARSQKKRELILATKALPLHQRLWLKALEANSYTDSIAHGALMRQGFTYPLSTVRNWKGHVRFKKALDLSMSLAVDDLSKDKILLNTQRVIDIALTPKPILYKGYETGYEEYDPTSALTGLRMLGQHQKLWNENDASRVTLEIELIDFASAPVPVTIDNDTKQIVDESAG